MKASERELSISRVVKQRGGNDFHKTLFTVSINLLSAELVDDFLLGTRKHIGRQRQNAVYDNCIWRVCNRPGWRSPLNVIGNDTIRTVTHIASYYEHEVTVSCTVLSRVLAYRPMWCPGLWPWTVLPVSGLRHLNVDVVCYTRHYLSISCLCVPSLIKEICENISQRCSKKWKLCYPWKMQPQSVCVCVLCV